MIRLFFNICYFFLLLIFSPFLLYSALFKGKYREGFGEKFLGKAPVLEKKKSGRRVWIHAVSVGEVNLAATILKEFERRHPDFEFVISSTSHTGMELARKKFAGRTVFYAPLDFSWAVRRAMKRVQPDFLVLIELEIWPNLLLTAEKLGVPVVVMNGRLGEKSFRNYSRIRPVMRRVMRTLTLVTAQDEASAERFRSLGVAPEKVFNVGSIKYDGAQSDRQNEKTRRLARLWNVEPTDRIFLAGSTQEPEEEMAVEVFRRLAPTHPELRLILVPRHPERFAEVEKLLEKTEFETQKRTDLSENHEENGRAQILLEHDRRAGRLVGNFVRRIRWGEHGLPRWAEYARTGGVRDVRLVRPEHVELPRHREETPDARCGGRSPRCGRNDGICAADARRRGFRPNAWPKRGPACGESAGRT